MWRRLSFWVALYPIIAHISLWSGHTILGAVYLLILMLFLSAQGTTFLRVLALSGLLMLIIGWFYDKDMASYLIYLPPSLISILLFMIFMRSLATNQTPMITRFAMMFESEPLSEERIRYTRKVTQVWAGLFLFMVIESILLALFAPQTVWSWMAHIGHYIMIIILLVAEFIYRRYRFAGQNVSFKQFVLQLSKFEWNKDHARL